MYRGIRYAARSLRKSPAYTAAALLTLALGIGANTAIFSALHGVVLTPLPFTRPDRLALLLLYNRSLKYSTSVSYPDFLDWQRNARSFSSIAAFWSGGYDLTSPGSPAHLTGTQISSNFFSTLGVPLALGHVFPHRDDRFGGAPSAVISHRLWRERFGANPSALGKSITVSGISYTIVGVLPASFRFEAEPADIFIPIGQGDPLFRMDRSIHDILCLARLAPGVSLPQAQAELNAVQQRIDELNPLTEKGQLTTLLPLKQFLIGDIGGTLFLLLGAVGLVLLIACANVANLLLARSASRTREFAVRRALGAGSFQLLRQLLTESLLLSLAGGVLGLAVAKWGLAAVLASAPGTLPRAENIGLNAPVLFFALAISLLVGIAFSLAPALKQLRVDLQPGLKSGGRGATAGHHHTQRALSVVQVALALVLLSGAGLLFRTIHNLLSVDPGFSPEHVLTFQAGLSPSLTVTPTATRAAFEQLTDGLREIPGVTSAGITALVPFSNNDNSGPFWLSGPPPASMAEIPRALYYATGPDYLRTLQIPLVRGRLLDAHDNLQAPLVVLIDTLLARRFFPGQDPLGQTITIPHWGKAHNVASRIVGVVGHVKQYGLDGSTGEKPEIYYSLYQLPDEGMGIFRNEVEFAVRTPPDAPALLPAIKDAVSHVSRGEPVYNIHPLRDLVSASLSRQRFPMILLAAFAILALLLSSVGIYGVLSYSTAQRLPEIGIRMALGATSSGVLRMLLRQALWIALSGVAIGTLAAFILTRVLASFSHLLYGVRPADPLTFIAVSLCLVSASLLASYLPARRAAKLDPMLALRQE